MIKAFTHNAVKSKAFTNYSPVSKALTDDFNNFEATRALALQQQAEAGLHNCWLPAICYPPLRRGCYASRLPLRLERIKSLAVTTKGANRTAKPKTSDATSASNESPGHRM